MDNKVLKHGKTRVATVKTVSRVSVSIHKRKTELPPIFHDLFLKFKTDSKFVFCLVFLFKFCLIIYTRTVDLLFSFLSFKTENYIIFSYHLL